MKHVLLRLLLISIGAFFIGAQAYQKGMVSAKVVSSMKTFAFRPKLKTMQAHMRVMREEYVRELPELKPVPDHINLSSGFGVRMHPVYKRHLMHWGIDFPVLSGTPVKAAANGLVLKVMPIGTKSSYGKYVVIAHDDTYKTLYAHLSKIIVREGELVEKGDIIARSGNTGISTSPHLHFEVIENGKRVNPLRFIKTHIPPPF